MVINTVPNLTDRLHGAWNVKLFSNELSILSIPYFSNISSEILILSAKLLNSQAVLIFLFEVFAVQAYISIEQCEKSNYMFLIKF